jgi:ankyrin repeat protein
MKEQNQLFENKEETSINEQSQTKQPAQEIKDEKKLEKVIIQRMFSAIENDSLEDLTELIAQLETPDIASIRYENAYKYNIKHGILLLDMAAEKASLKIVEFLVGKGCDVNRKSKSRRSPLHFAAENKLKEVAEFLLDQGADLNALDDSSKTPLFNAAYWGSLEVVKLFIRRGANIHKNVDTTILLSIMLHMGMGA